MNIKNNYLTRIGLYRKYVEELGPFDPYLAQMGYKETYDVAMYYIETPGVEWVDIKDKEDKIIGFVIFSTAEEDHHPATDYGICQTYILPTYRRQGIMTKAVLSYLKLHPGAVSLDILKKNDKAKAFWKKVMYKVNAFELPLNEIRTGDLILYTSLYGYYIPEK